MPKIEVKNKIPISCHRSLPSSMMVSVITLVDEKVPSEFMKTSPLFKDMVKLRGLLMLLGMIDPSSLAEMFTVSLLENSRSEGEMAISDRKTGIS